MKAPVLYTPPITADVIAGPWSGRTCVIKGWYGPRQVFAFIASAREKHKLRRCDLRIHSLRDSTQPPPDWPGAA